MLTQDHNVTTNHGTVTTFKQEQDSQLRTDSLTTLNNVLNIDTQALTISFNQQILEDHLPSVFVNVDHLKKVLANAPERPNFNKHCKQLVQPVQLSRDVIPILAHEFEVIEYERLFEQDSSIVNELTIADILSPFSFPKKISESTSNSKLTFIRQFLRKVSRLPMDYNFAITCMSEQYEQELFNVLDDKFTTYKEDKRKNVIARMKLSEYAPSKNIYGIIYKHRKEATYTDRSCPSVLDLVLVYDSACRVGSENIFDLFTGTHTRKPFLLYLCVTDSLEARLHNYNSFSTMNTIDWNTKLCDLTNEQRMYTLYQPNRHVNVNAHTTNWSTVTAHSLIQWIKTKSNIMYTFAYPTKTVKKVFLSFPHHHPLDTISHRRITRTSRSNNVYKHKKTTTPPQPLSKKKRKDTTLPQPPLKKKKVSHTEIATSTKELAYKNGIIRDNMKIRETYGNDYLPDLPPSDHFDNIGEWDTLNI